MMFCYALFYSEKGLFFSAKKFFYFSKNDLLVFSLSKKSILFLKKINFICKVTNFAF